MSSSEELMDYTIQSASWQLSLKVRVHSNLCGVCGKSNIAGANVCQQLARFEYINEFNHYASK